MPDSGNSTCKIFLNTGCFYQNQEFIKSNGESLSNEQKRRLEWQEAAESASRSSDREMGEEWDF